MTARERLEQRALLLDAAARGVDVDRALLQQRERLVADHPARLVRERRVTRENVDLRQQRLQAPHGLGAATPHFVGRHVLVVCEDAHPDRARKLRHTAPDVADADDAERLAGELRVSATPRGPVAGPRRLVDEQRALHADEHQHQRVLGDGLRVRARPVDDGDPETRGGGNVDDVEAGAVAADHPHVRASNHQAFCTAWLRAQEDAVGVGGRLHEPRLVLVGAHDDARLRFEERLALGMDVAAKHDERTSVRTHTRSLSLSLEWPALYVCYRGRP